MKIVNNLDIIARKNGGLLVTYKTARVIVGNNDAYYAPLLALYNASYGGSDSDRLAAYAKHKDALETFFDTLCASPDNSANPNAPVDTTQTTIASISRMIKFFREFDFTPNYRFINSLGWACAKSPKDAYSYIVNYFRLLDSPYAKDIEKKIKSDEFKMIIADFSLTPPNKHINERFAVYYGNAGTGKTTLAQKECENRCVVCNNSMLPADLMEDFVFIDGKPSFKPSILWECMTNGKPIVLDEINLLPFDSLRFLQGILDGKTEFAYKGHTVTIAHGFAVIGTMNLVVNGSVFNLPEPLVDRCADIREFSLSAKDLFNALS